jgi:crotonobetainyl-CoA:carnitine CoA-transferase CaiB-like acyl-CoA transferase
MGKLTQAISQWQRDELGRACDEAGVPAGPINSVDEVFADPHVLARGMRSEFTHPTLGSFDAVPLPFKFDGWDNPVAGTPPLLGEHTETLLEGIGYSPERIAQLRAAKAI